jgi:hypothetical protein
MTIFLSEEKKQIGTNSPQMYLSKIVSGVCGQFVVILTLLALLHDVEMQD